MEMSGSDVSKPQARQRRTQKVRTVKAKIEGRCHLPHSGIAYAVCASFFLTLSMLAGKKIRHLSGPEVSWLRFCVMGLLAFPYVSIKGHKLFDYKGNKRWLFLRAVCAAVGTLALYTAILIIPLPDATAVKYCSVALTPLFAALLLRERMTLLQGVTIIICLLGIICIANPFKISSRIMAAISLRRPQSPGLNQSTLPAQMLTETLANMSKMALLNATETPKRPSSTVMTFGVLLAGVTSICEAMAYCVTRRMSCAGIPASVIIINQSAYGIILTLFACFIYRAINGSIPTLTEWDLAFVALTGTSSVLGHLLLIKALHREHTGLVSIVRSMDIVFSFVYQYAFFHVRPTIMTFVGTALIVVSVVTISFVKIRQQHKNKGVRRQDETTAATDMEQVSRNKATVESQVLLNSNAFKHLSNP